MSSDNANPGPGVEHEPQGVQGTTAIRPPKPRGEIQASEQIFPAVGEMLADCRLLAVLGSGVRGQVFLAAQTLLGDRLVVLKVTSMEGGEHLSLARLLHTHIAPLLFAQELPSRNLRVLAMPFLGGAPLSAVLAKLREIPCRERTGGRLVAALDSARDTLPGNRALVATTPIRERLGRLSYPSAVCWLGACLADALQHAHERGLVHLDVKPDNVLLAADAQPLLLDFHLARSPLDAGSSPPEWFGGTPSYMAPEQMQVMYATAGCQPAPASLDGRADLYSLGVVLYELLAGVLPPGAGDLRVVSQQLRRRNPQVSVGLADVVARCLAGDPSARYDSAGALGGDLRRHLAHLPLEGVVNRDLRERWRKWRLRRPHTLRWAALVFLVLTALASSLVLGALELRQRGRLAEQSLEEGLELLTRGDADEAVRAFQRGRVTGWFPGDGSLRQRLADQAGRAEQIAREQRQKASRRRQAGELARLADELRFFWDVDTLPVGPAQTLEGRCGRLWQQRSTFLTPKPSDREANDLIEMTALWAKLQVRLASVDRRQETTTEALKRLDELEQILGPSFAFDLERQALAPKAGKIVVRPPRTAWEHYMRGRALLRAGDIRQAADHFSAAVSLQPDGFWPNFYQGVCAHRLRQYEEAVAAFRTCIALAPLAAPCYLNRALDWLALGRATQAHADLDRAIQIEPGLADAWLQRGLMQAEAKQPDSALSDLHRALELGADPARCHYNLAQIYKARGERELALQHARMALQSQPTHAGARRLLDSLQGRP